jgi:hypothetical protein
MKRSYIVALFGLALICVFAVIFVSVVRSAMASHYIEGTVVDSSGAPLSGVTVAVSNRGWGFSSGGLVWDKAYVYQTTSDSSGRFRIAYDVGGSAHVIATAPGYQPYDGWHDHNSTVTLRLKQHNARYVPLPNGILELGTRNGKPYGWIFAEQRTTFDPQAADLFPQITGPLRSTEVDFTLQAAGGIARLTNEQLGASADPLVYADAAPTQGYTSSLPFDPQPGGVYFVKTRDGQRFAKFATSFVTVGSEQEIRQGNWGVRLEYVYNPSGSPDLTFQR